MRRAISPAICLKITVRALAFYGDDVLLVFFRGIRAHGVEKFALLIAHIADHAGNRRPIYMDIEDVEKDADAAEGFSVNVDGEKCR